MMIHHDRGIEKLGEINFRTEPLTESVYRYRPINEWLRQILVQDEIYFASPAKCNDPFDCRVAVSEDLTKGLLNRLEEAQAFAQVEKQALDVFGTEAVGDRQFTDEFASLSETEFAKFQGRVLEKAEGLNADVMGRIKSHILTRCDRIGICCFASRGDNLLMYSHYASQHSGCCLEFQIRDERGRRDSIFEESGDSTIFLREVRYDDQPPVVGLFDTITSMVEVVSTKHTRWAYEEELRAIRWNGPGPVRYRRKALTGIIFGCRTAASDIAQVREWIGPRTGVVLSRAVMTDNLSLSIAPV
jgi:Protein of unknown function (DUF2971)